MRRNPTPNQLNPSLLYVNRLLKGLNSLSYLVEMVIVIASPTDSTATNGEQANIEHPRITSAMSSRLTVQFIRSSYVQNKFSELADCFSHLFEKIQ